MSEHLQNQWRQTIAAKTGDFGKFWHGSPSGELRGAAYGLHIGTKEAATEALNARIGTPVEGGWDGTREYGKTLLCGQKRLKARGDWPTGYSARCPQEDAFPTGEADYSDGTKVSMSARPDIFAVEIIGPMTNTPSTAMSDSRANGQMKSQVTKGNAKNGYFYTNDGEDSGSVSAVVPSGGAHLRRVSHLVIATKVDGDAIMKMLDRRYMSRPDPQSISKYDWIKTQPEYALLSLDGAMNRYRSSFGASDRIRAGAQGQGSAEDQKFGKAILAGIEQGDIYSFGYRVSHGEAPSVGQILSFPLVSLAKTLDGARGFENSSNFAGVGPGRGNWMVFEDFPAVEYPDGREYISSGRFVVDSVRPFTPPWEGKPGSDITLAGKRTKADLRYVGPY